MTSRRVTFTNRCPLACLLGLLLVAGCQHKGPQMASVTGTVKFSDGSVPTGEVVVIRFEPVVNEHNQISPKAASGDIKPDGSFKLMTIKPGDGAIVGDYKVVFTCWKTYMKREPLVAPIFTTAAGTPHMATVRPDVENRFDFVIEPAAP